MVNMSTKFKTFTYLIAAALLALVTSCYPLFIKRESAGLPLFLIAVTAVFLAVVSKLFCYSPKHKEAALMRTILFLAAPLLMETAVELCNGNLLTDILYAGNIFANYFLNLLIYMILFLLSGRAKFSIRTGSLILLLFGIINMYVKDYKGSPLLPWDIGSFMTAANVAVHYSYSLSYPVAYSLSLFFYIFVLSGCLPKEHKGFLTSLLRGTFAGILIVVFGIFYGTDYAAEALGAAPDFFNQTRGYEQKGAVAGFFVNTKYMRLSKPDDYDAKTLVSEVEEVLPSSDTPILKKSGEDLPETPDIIVIMDEAFSDLSVIGDFTTNVDYMPYLHSMEGADNTVTGYNYVSTIGTGTSNTEYEFLTGNPMAFLPIGANAYQLYENHTQPGLVSSLKAYDYQAYALHTYYRTSWNRVNTYQYMGFDSFTSMEDLTDYVKLRSYISDEWDFNKIIEMYQERDTSRPFFLFNVTMQNHSPYDLTLDEDVKLMDMEGEYPLTEQYLSLIKITDDALEDLVSYFRTVDRPVLLLFFGDHQPFIENGFYSEVMGSSLNALSDEDNQKRYITPFFLWANYDIPEGSIDKISTNYLQDLLLDQTSMNKTAYSSFRHYAYTKVPVISQLGCIDKKENYFKVDDDERPDLLSVYEHLAYNNLIENEERADELFYPETN